MNFEPFSQELVRNAEAVRGRSNLRLYLLGPSGTAPAIQDSASSVLARSVGNYAYAPAAAAFDVGQARAELPVTNIPVTNSSTTVGLQWQGLAIISGSSGSELIHFLAWSGTVNTLSPGQSGTIPVAISFGGPTANVTAE